MMNLPVTVIALILESVSQCLSFMGKWQHIAEIMAFLETIRTQSWD
jgi:hypothetical protein